VTACVIASDEERRLPACLRSLDFCDQIVVVDGGSRDRTAELAAAAGALVVENPWPGFAAQRNVALDRASGDWVLEIDADERVSPKLAAEIRSLLADPPAGVRMAALPMRDVFLGARLGPSARYPRYRHRLFRRGSFRHDESRAVHEGLWPDGPVQTLEGELEHLLAGSLGEALADAIAYARLEGLQRGRPAGRKALAAGLLRPAIKFAYRFGLYGGWRDGARGLLRIALECGADSLAVLYGSRTGSLAATSHTPAPPRVGPVRVVGVAAGRRRAAGLAHWLDEAEAAGADVASVTAALPGGLARALDAADQARPIDVLVLAGRRERLLLAFCPQALRGATEPSSTSIPPADAVRRLQSELRGG